MIKRREPVDPFGLSLLDVLSNALGGLILLMLVVAITTKGNDEKRLNLPSEDTQGQNYTVVTVSKKKKPELKFNLLIAQINLYGSSAELSLAGEFTGNCSLSSRGDSLKRQWLAIRLDNMQNKEWEVKFKNPSDHPGLDSIAILVTCSDLVTCYDVIKYEPGQESILKVREMLKSQPEISFLGRPCNLNPNLNR